MPPDKRAATLLIGGGPRIAHHQLSKTAEHAPAFRQSRADLPLGFLGCRSVALYNPIRIRRAAG
jgi:hypothetical protein